MIEKHREQLKAGSVAFQILEELQSKIKPGINALEIEKFAREHIERSGNKPAFLHYKGYPAVTCISVNSAVVHGIPNNYILEEGDVVTVDVGVNSNGWLVDTARTYGVGKISAENTRLLAVTEHALENAINLCQVNGFAGDIGESIQHEVESAGYAIIKELSGHGVGKTLQEAPSIPNYGKSNTGAKLYSGLSIAIEPITATKKTKVGILDDGWTIITEESVVAAHFEHTIGITENGPVVLTKPSQ